MSEFSNLENDVNKEAQDHPQQEQELLNKGEQQVDQATGNKDDNAVGKAGQDFEKEL